MRSLDAGYFIQKARTLVLRFILIQAAMDCCLRDVNAVIEDFADPFCDSSSNTLVFLERFITVRIRSFWN